MEAAVQIVILEDCEDFRSDLATYGGCRADLDLINDAEFQWQKVYKEAMGCPKAVEEIRGSLCEICGMWVRDVQWQDHSIGRKHKKNLKRAHGEPDPEPKSEGLVIPKATVLIIEQTAIYNDAVGRYVLSIYDRGLLRSRL